MASVVSLNMRKDRNVKTIQGNLEIWEHEVGDYNAEAEQKYASRIFNKQKSQHIFKVHSSAKALDAYISGLNIIIHDNPSEK